MYHQTWQDSSLVLITLWLFVDLLLAPSGRHPPLATAFSLSHAVGLRPCFDTSTTRLRPTERLILSTKFDQEECRSINNKKHDAADITHDHKNHHEYQQAEESCHVLKNLLVATVLEQNVNNDKVCLQSSCDPTSSSPTNQNEESQLQLPSTSIPTGLEPWQEDELEQIFDEALFRMAFVMEHEALAKTSNPAVRDMFQACLESVTIGPSTIPGAGRGLFATRDISPGTIVAFYPIHAIGCKFPSGSCLSVQIAERPEDLIQDVEQSAYALFSLKERPLLGVDLRTRYNPPLPPKNNNNNNNHHHEYSHYPRLFVDMNPKAKLQDGWFCGLINDAGIVKYLGDVDYYRISRGPKRNIEIVPFSHAAPFQVGVTTRHVQKGEELFVSYGYSYWASKIPVPTVNDRDDHQQQQSSLARTDTHHHHQQQQEQLDEIQRQEELASVEIAQWIQTVQDRYAVAAQGVAEIFEGLDDLPMLAPTTCTGSARQEEQEHSSPRRHRRQRRLKNIPKRLQQVIHELVGLIPNLSKKLPRRLSPRLLLMFRRQ